MSRLDRALGIILLLRSGQRTSAADIARHFEVSTRTVYRDVELLSSLGVPIYAERGHGGGLRLLAGYFLPPVMLTTSEAVSLLLARTLLGSLASQPFARDLESAEAKLLAAVPERIRTTLTRTKSVVGFEGPPVDVFHPEATTADAQLPLDLAGRAPGQVTEVFLQALLDRRGLALHYQALYRQQETELTVEPEGVFWDRGHWYLVGRTLGSPGRQLWRADRVRRIVPTATPIEPRADFDVRSLLGRQWLRAALQSWVKESPVSIKMTKMQAERLQRDWYYGAAHFDETPGGEMLMTFGDDNEASVHELVRWLGPGAELLSPPAWRESLRHELDRLRAIYQQ